MSSWYYLPMRHDVSWTLYREMRRKDNHEDKETRPHIMIEGIVTHNIKEYWYNVPVKTSTNASITDLI